VFDETEPLDDENGAPVGTPGLYPKLNWLKAGMLSSDKVKGCPLCVSCVCVVFWGRVSGFTSTYLSLTSRPRIIIILHDENRC
jgi:hypothetical protein